MLSDNRAALALITRALDPLERVGGFADLVALHDRLTRQLAREELLVELVGNGRWKAIEALLGEAVFPTEETVAIRVKRARALWYRARFNDGRIEEPPPDRVDELTWQLAERELDLVAATEAARNLGEQLQEAARAVAHERTLSVAVDEELALARKKRVAAALVTLPPPTANPHGGWRAWWRALRAFVARLFGRAPATERSLPAAPSSPVAIADDGGAQVREVAARAAERARALQPAVETVERLNEELAAVKARVTTFGAERERLRQELDAARALRTSHALARLHELTLAREPELAALEVEGPRIPSGVVLLLPPSSGDGRDDSADFMLDLAGAPSGEQLLRRLAQLEAQRPVEQTRRVAAALHALRERLVESERHERRSYQARVEALAARRTADPVGLKQRELATVQRRAAREAERIAEEAVQLLEERLGEVRLAWQERISACTAVEQLRSELTTIEDGAAHRLSLVADELREAITLGAVRQVLEFSRPLRQELHAQRAAVTHGSAPHIEEAFAGLRLVLPSSLDATFDALRAPVGALRTPGSLLDPLFRTLDRDKRACIARLGARLDELGQTTTRELFAATVFLSPLLCETYGQLVAEMVTTHERWLDARLLEEQVAYGQACARLDPALALIPQLTHAESRLEQNLGAKAAPAAAT